MKRTKVRESPDELHFASAADALEAIQSAFGTPRLTVELVPRSTWSLNLRSLLRQTAWDKLRKATYAAANHRCEICNGVGPRHPVECHEVWHYSDGPCVQRLIGLVALCPSCHAAKHFGLADVRGYELDVRLHIAEVNRWSLDDVRRYLDFHFALWTIRNRKEWDLDLTWLAKFKVAPAPKRYLRARSV